MKLIKYIGKGNIERSRKRIKAYNGEDIGGENVNKTRNSEYKKEKSTDEN